MAPLQLGLLTPNVQVVTPFTKTICFLYWSRNQKLTEMVDSSNESSQQPDEECDASLTEGNTLMHKSLKKVDVPNIERFKLNKRPDDLAFSSLLHLNWCYGQWSDNQINPIFNWPFPSFFLSQSNYVRLPPLWLEQWFTRNYYIFKNQNGYWFFCPKDIQQGQTRKKNWMKKVEYWRAFLRKFWGRYQFSVFALKTLNW